MILILKNTFEFSRKCFVRPKDIFLSVKLNFFYLIIITFVIFYIFIRLLLWSFLILLYLYIGTNVFLRLYFYNFVFSMDYWAHKMPKIFEKVFNFLERFVRETEWHDKSNTRFSWKTDVRSNIYNFIHINILFYLPN